MIGSSDDAQHRSLPTKAAYYELTWKKIKDEINMGKNREIVEVQVIT